MAMDRDEAEIARSLRAQPQPAHPPENWAASLRLARDTRPGGGRHGHRGSLEWLREVGIEV
jgi:hypothetical protein